MPFNTKVKKTGQLFEAISEEHSSSNVHVLEAGKSYSGFLYDGYFTDSKGPDGLVEFVCTKERSRATFSEGDLVQLSLPIKLRFAHIRKRTGAPADDPVITVECTANGRKVTLFMDDPPKVGQAN